MNEIQPGAILEVPNQPMQVLVLHEDSRWNFGKLVRITLLRKEPYLQRTGVVTQCYDTEGNLWYHVPIASLLPPGKIKSLRQIAQLPDGTAMSISADMFLTSQFNRMA